ncbi:MAG: hypothetical protein HY647_09865 [Acidobacteria bacterium]|nr:hypothetical protein [Acidobacteriota bacterium]
MLSFRMAFLPMTLFLLAAQPATILHAQQRSDRRVFTNEDVARPEAALPPAETPPEDSASAERTEPPAPSAESAGGPQTELKRAHELQAILRDAINEFNEKYDKETIEARKLRWETMVDCLNTLIQYNQLRINELQGGSQPPAEAAP